MPYKNIAIIGAGVLGTPIAKALLQAGANVIVVSRPASSSGKDLPAGAKVVAVDYTDISALAALFKEHATEVVISTIAIPALGLQLGLGDAAKQGGVELFVPSDFALDTPKYREAMPAKAALAVHLKSIGLPSARVFNGLFTEFIPWLLNVDSGKIHLIGKGDQKLSATHTDDIAGFVAYILTHLPASELHDKVFRIEGDRATLNDVIGYYGGKYAVEHVDAVGDAVGDDAFKTFIQVVTESGQGQSLAVEGAATDNALWPGHAWKGIKEVLGL